MELSYWISRWNKGNTGFHMENGYSGLEKHWPSLNIPAEGIALVPLCGKSLDLIWLSNRLKKVIGVEISEKAIIEFLKENKLNAEKNHYTEFTIYKAENTELWCGDFLKLPVHKIPELSLVYDKAALTALPEPMRKKYTTKVQSLMGNHTKLLLHHFVYPQQEMKGPPFSVSVAELNNFFDHNYTIKQLEKNELDLLNYQKFLKRGLKTYLIEYLLLLYNNQGNKN